MEKLWKAVTIIGGMLGAVCFLVMSVYSMNKSIVITEEQELKGEGNLEPLTEAILKERQEYDFIVLINAAHGGENKGNVVNELQEKQITLDVGKKLEKMSKENEIGFFLIREEDTDISNENRAKLIQRVEPDLVVDLHVNADPDSERTFGTAVIYNEDFYRPVLTNAKAADLMEKQLVTRIKGKALGIMGDTEKKYPLLSMIRVPAVSIEMGFLTNKQESELLKKESYQKKIAAGIYDGVESIRKELREE